MNSLYHAIIKLTVYIPNIHDAISKPKAQTVITFFFSGEVRRSIKGQEPKYQKRILPKTPVRVSASFTDVAIQLNQSTSFRLTDQSVKGHRTRLEFVVSEGHLVVSFTASILCQTG